MLQAVLLLVLGVLESWESKSSHRLEIWQLTIGWLAREDGIRERELPLST
jgi:hypothetical protein